jgi:hypothetical protein
MTAVVERERPGKNEKYIYFGDGRKNGNLLGGFRFRLLFLIDRSYMNMKLQR